MMLAQLFTLVTWLVWPAAAVGLEARQVSSSSLTYLVEFIQGQVISQHAIPPHVLTELLIKVAVLGCKRLLQTTGQPRHLGVPSPQYDFCPV